MYPKYKNFSEFLKTICRLYGTKGALYWKQSTNDNEYKELSGNKLLELVYFLSKALKRFGLNRFDKAAIISESRYEWVVTDFSCIINNLITVPVYTTMTTEQIKYILKHSECKLCFVSNKLIAEKISAISDELPDLKKIITFNKTDLLNEKIISFEELIYQELLDDSDSYSIENAYKIIDCSIANQTENDLLTIIYTSGTTGIPKGVCLTHKNILTNIEQCTDAFPVDESDVFLSFLPLAHTYERTCGYYVPLSKGAKIYYAKSIDTLSAQMLEVKPTLMLGVPILYNKIHARVIKNIDSMPLIKKSFAKKALSIGKKFRNNKNSIFWKIADKKVFTAIREKTGGRIKFLISGGSALSKETAEFFDSIGILILQGYGMTEASPVISVNRLDKNKFGTVGIALNGIEINIADDGEILVRGNNVMQGYYKNEKDTDETIKDGWLHTGDIGHIDKDGFITITDRKKSLIKTSSGKYISLTHIEETLENSEYIEQVIAFASDTKHFVSAIIVPNFEYLEDIAKKLDVKYNKISDLTDNDVIHNFYESEIDVLQRPLAKYERVRKFVLLDRPFTIENQELTPTMKLKRKVIEEKYKHIIDGFYR